MNRSSQAFLIALALAHIVGSSGFAHATAFDREMSAMYCAPYNNNDQWGSYSITNLSLTTPIVYACSVPNDYQRNLTQTLNSSTAIQVYGSTVSTTGIRTWACLSHYATTGGTCGTEVNNGSTTGLVTLSPAPATWRAATNTNDTPYLKVTIAPCRYVDGVCTGLNQVRGYKVTYVDL